MKKPIKKAAAITYKPGDEAPQIIEKGKGIVAENILEEASVNAVPIHEDSKLADLLTQMEIGDFIPPELYAVVAEILVFVSDLDKLHERIKKI
jgi:flagellar biosynthesis protein